MNKDSFSFELSRLITGYIDDHLENEREFRDNPYHRDKHYENLDDPLTIIEGYVDQNRIDCAIDIVLENPLFEVERDEIVAHSNDKEYARHIYLNIGKIYEELKHIKTLVGND